MEVWHLVPWVSLELAALAVKDLHLLLAPSLPQDSPPARQGTAPLGPVWHKRKIASKLGWKEFFFFSTDHFKALVTKAQTHTGDCPLSLLGEYFRQLQEQIWGR